MHTPVVTRIAPSPTGSFHIGTARTALYNYLFAKKYNGTFIVRFEDTDRERSDRRYEKEILFSLYWLGLRPDTVVRQSDRRRLYAKYIAQLLDAGLAYTSREPSKKDPAHIVEVIRFHNREPVVSFTDTIRGDITIDTSELGDFVIARAADDPLYNLAVSIDDYEMGITHVLRGDDHISNTPRQILLLRALGAPLPVYTHIPLIHSPSGGKLSKRKDAVSITEFRNQGYLPEALVNAIALLGWSPEDDRELFDLPDLITAFDPGRIHTKEAVMNEKKMRWFNRQYIRSLPQNRLRGEIVPELLRRFPLRSRLFPRSVRAVLEVVSERGELLAEERAALKDGAFDFFFVDPLYDTSLLLPQGVGRDSVRQGLEHSAVLLGALNAYQQWDTAAIREAVWSHAEERGRSAILWPLRVALSGMERSPDPFFIAAALGQSRTLRRIRRAIHLLAGESGKIYSVCV